jgi:hypothetical protein
MAGVHALKGTTSNPYEASLCQEPHDPSERTLCCGSAFQGLAQSASGLWGRTGLLWAGANRTWLHHTPREARSPRAWRVQSPVEGRLCGLARRLCPRTVLCLRAAAPRRGRPFGAGAEEGQHPGTRQRPAPSMRRGRGGPSNASGSGRGGRGTVPRAKTRA